MHRMGKYIPSKLLKQSNIHPLHDNDPHYFLKDSANIHIHLSGYCVLRLALDQTEPNQRTVWPSEDSAQSVALFSSFFSFYSPTIFFFKILLLPVDLGSTNSRHITFVFPSIKAFGSLTSGEAASVHPDHS